MSVHSHSAGHSNGFQDIATYGGYYRRDVAESGSGPTALACYVVLSVVACAGYGMPRTTSGPRSTRNISNVGYTSTPVRSHGTTHDYTQKVGKDACLIASLSA